MPRQLANRTMDADDPAPIVLPRRIAVGVPRQMRGPELREYPHEPVTFLIRGVFLCAQGGQVGLVSEQVRSVHLEAVRYREVVRRVAELFVGDLPVSVKCGNCRAQGSQV